MLWTEELMVCCVLQHFETDTEDLAGLEWSPDGRVLCVWESCLQVSSTLGCADILHSLQGLKVFII